MGKFGSFIACSNYPECKYTRKLSENGGDELNGNSGFDGEKSFGFDPVTNDEVYLKKGPYGIYLQLGKYFLWKICLLNHLRKIATYL